MGFFKNFLEARAVRTNPAYAEEQAINNQRAYDEQQAQAWGQQANNVYGTQAQAMNPGTEVPNRPTQFGQMDMNVGGTEVPRMEGFQAPQDATGAFTGASPEQIRQLGLAKRAMQTGQIPGMQMQRSMVNPFQASSLANEQSGINNKGDNQRALQQTRMNNRQSGLNNQATIQGQQVKALATDPFNQFQNNKDAYAAFMDLKNKSQANAKNPSGVDKELAGVINAQKNQYEKRAAPLRDSITSFKDMIALSQPQADGSFSGVNDMSLIYKFMKTIDPRAIVTDKDFEATGNAGGLPTKVQTFFNQLRDGTLPSTTRSQMMQAASKFANSSVNELNQVRKFQDITSNDIGLTSPVYDPNVQYNEFELQGMPPQQPIEAAVNNAVNTVGNIPISIQERRDELMRKAQGQ